MSTSNSMELPVWVCDVCERPIIGDSGYLEIINLDPDAGEVGGDPRIPTVSFADWDRCRNPDKTSGLRLWTTTELFDAVEAWEQERKIGFKVVHRACDPTLSVQGYWITIEDIDNHHDWIRCLRHLAEKQWLGKDDLIALMDLWPAYEYHRTRRGSRR